MRQVYTFTLESIAIFRWCYQEVISFNSHRSFTYYVVCSSCQWRGSTPCYRWGTFTSELWFFRTAMSSTCSPSPVQHLSSLRGHNTFLDYNDTASLHLLSDWLRLAHANMGNYDSPLLPRVGFIQRPPRRLQTQNDR